LLESTFAVEHSVLEGSLIDASVGENLCSFTVRLVISKKSFVDTSVRESESPLPLFHAVFPFSGVSGPVLPLTDRDTAHFSAFPEPVILPALFFADKES